jgi:hypothetical protein
VYGNIFRVDRRKCELTGTKSVQDMLTKIYYILKPVIPYRLRVAMRRGRAKALEATSKDVWPILESSKKPPEGWPGWPEGKKFAFVLTHDVEGLRGVNKTEKLMDVEEGCGFKSSFNFIPRGDCEIPKAIRDEVTRRGFEVGVHDLYHDGKLYSSAATFQRLAPQINEYLKEWNSVGFRAGFMRHNLEWIQSLNVSYDCSTFDTDPFEPQNDGMGTIFPFWVEDRKGARTDGRAGYVELPYTLVQDFNHFVILKRNNWDLWKEKTDWVAANGGMVLLNTHPDYMHFAEGKAPFGEFPVGLYEGFLKYVRSKYGGQYWHALPRDLASWYYKHCVRPVTKAAMAFMTACELTQNFVA